MELRPSRPWTLAEVDAAELDELQRRHSVGPTIARLLAARGHVAGEACAQHLAPNLGLLRPPELLPDMAAATERLARALEQEETILVHGDYDVDGVTGTTILVRLLRLLGGRVEWHIPHRMRDGYSFGDHSIERAQAVGASVVVSVDNGTSAIDVITRLKELGIDTVVTDHHEPPRDGALPPATAIVNPKVEREQAETEGEPGRVQYPFRELCGGAVAFKLAWGLCQAIEGTQRVGHRLKGFLEDAMGLVAVATVCDVVPLIDENRLLAKAGLKQLAATQHAGTRALLKVCGLEGKDLAADDVGYSIGPRINAAGRLDSAARAVELLLEEDAERAKQLAEDLEALNQQRRAMTDSLMEAAHEQARAFADPTEYPVLVLADQGWHQGLVGIVAGRMVEAYGRPTLVVGLDGEEGRGSARTIPDVNVLSILDAGAEHLLRHGGHAQAAGCEVRADAISGLREALCQAARETGVTDRLGPPSLRVDAVVRLAEIDESFQHALDRLEPFGERNEKPHLMSPGVRLAELPQVTRDGRHMILRLRDGARVLKGMAFGQAHRAESLKLGTPLRVVHTPVWNTWRGRRDQELLIHDFGPDQEA